MQLKLGSTNFSPVDCLNNDSATAHITIDDRLQRVGQPTEPEDLVESSSGKHSRYLVSRAANDPSVFTITEKAPTRAFSSLKAPT